jgi:hypothetical protein
MGTVKQRFMQKPIDTIFILTLMAQNTNKNLKGKKQMDFSSFILPHWTALICTLRSFVTVQK